MRNSVKSGRRLAARVFALQVASTLAVAALWLASGPDAAAGALCGGLAVALGTGLFALRYFAREGMSAGSAIAGLVVATAVKWLCVVVVLYVAIARLELPELAVLTGLATAVATNLFGLRMGASDGD